MLIRWKKGIYYCKRLKAIYDFIGGKLGNLDATNAIKKNLFDKMKFFVIMQLERTFPK